jgi:pimeloyl-ACP methyl ester carboxylesterase
MYNRIIFLLYLAVMPSLLLAQQDSSKGNASIERRIISDLGRIVNPNGIQENYEVKIGGINQSVYVRGQNRDNPVILFIHGGPASPMSPVMWMFQRPIEEYYTVVNWDQRGSGRTYLNVSPDAISNTIKIDNYVSDAVELATYIKQRYHATKIILIAHSWGTIIGVKAALKRPDLFYAYVGIGQIVNIRDNEQVSFDYAVSQAEKFKNDTALAALRSIAPYPGDQPITRERIIIARNWAQYYGGLSAFRNESMYFFDGPLLSPEYTRKDVAAIDQGNLFTLSRILPEFLAVDFKKIRKFPIPIFIFMGKYDYTTPSVPAATWLKGLSAPVKKGVWFENSSHLIPFEEPGKMLIELRNCLTPVVTRK